MELNNILTSRRERQNIYYQLSQNELLQGCLVLANRPKDKLMETTPEI